MQASTAAARPARPATASGRPALISRLATVMVTSVPIITTSPWAKLIRPMIPYTIVYPSATSA
jgi:hypothetical protein